MCLQAMQLQAQVYLHRRKYSHAESCLQSAVAAARRLKPHSPHSSSDQLKPVSAGGAGSPADAGSVVSSLMEADEEARHAYNIPRDSLVWALRLAADATRLHKGAEC